MYKDKYLFHKSYVSVMYVYVDAHICTYVVVPVYFLLWFHSELGIYCFIA